jgi:hypothetical protein
MASTLAFAIFNPTAWLRRLGNLNIGILEGTGAPTSGGSGTAAGKAGIGCLYVDSASGLYYVNTGTKASPTWTQLTIAGGAGLNSAQSVAAAGSVQGDAAAITASAPGNILGTGANATKGIILPAAVAGAIYNIKNADAANAVLKVYPAGTDTINALSASAAISMAAKTSAVFMCVTAGSWLTLPLVPS